MQYTCATNTTGTVSDAMITFASWVSAATTTTSDAVWSNWTTNTAVTYSSVIPVSGNGRSLKTEKYYAQERKKEQIRKKRMHRNAEAMMKHLLTQDEFREWRLYKSVRITGSLGGMYEIGAGYHGKHLVKLNAKLDPECWICYQPDSTYCVQDRVAALILDIKCDESRIIKLGNKSAIKDQGVTRKIVCRRYFRQEYDKQVA